MVMTGSGDPGGGMFGAALGPVVQVGNEAAGSGDGGTQT